MFIGCFKWWSCAWISYISRILVAPYFVWLSFTGGLYVYTDGSVSPAYFLLKFGPVDIDCGFFFISSLFNVLYPFINFLNYGMFELVDVEFIPGSINGPLVSLSYILRFLLWMKFGFADLLIRPFYSMVWSSSSELELHSNRLLLVFFFLLANNLLIF